MYVCIPKYLYHTLGPGMPESIGAVATAFNEIMVYWEEVPAIDRNGIILLYEVLFCSTLNCSHIEAVNTTDATTLNLTLDNLEEFTEYNISVRAYTNVGAGENTSVITVVTLVKGMFTYLMYCINFDPYLPYFDSNAELPLPLIGVPITALLMAHVNDCHFLLIIIFMNLVYDTSIITLPIINFYSASNHCCGTS